MKTDSFDWIDVLVRRWQFIVALVGAVIWLTTIQMQVSQASQNQSKMMSEIESFSDIKAEWPYLKEKVSNIDKKMDILLSRVNN